MPLDLKPRVPVLEIIGLGKILQEPGLTIQHAVIPHKVLGRYFVVLATEFKYETNPKFMKCWSRGVLGLCWFVGHGRNRPVTLSAKGSFLNYFSAKKGHQPVPLWKSLKSKMAPKSTSGSKRGHETSKNAIRNIDLKGRSIPAAGRSIPMSPDFSFLGGPRKAARN